MVAVLADELGAAVVVATVAVGTVAVDAEALTFEGVVLGTADSGIVMLFVAGFGPAAEDTMVAGPAVTMWAEATAAVETAAVALRLVR